MRRGAAGLSCGWRVATRTHTVPLTRPHLPSDANAPVFRGVVEVEVEGRGGGGLAGDRQNTREKNQGRTKGLWCECRNSGRQRGGKTDITSSCENHVVRFCFFLFSFRVFFSSFALRRKTVTFSAKDPRVCVQVGRQRQFQ